MLLEAATQFSIVTHNGTITVTNPQSGQHRTFRIRTQASDAKFAPGERIVSLLTGQDNQSDYTSFGIVKEGGRIVLWRKFHGTKYEQLANMLSNAERSVALWGMRFEWSAKCRKCNRELTCPESLASGIGPVCEGRE